MREYILGIDASLSCTGYAILEKSTKDVVFVNKKTTTTKDSEDTRIFNITNELLEQVERYNIKEAIMEDQFLGKNASTAMKLSRLRGAIAFGLMYKQVKLTYLQPASIRKTLMGVGNASKEEVAEFVQDMYKDNIYVQALGEFNDKNNKNKNSDMYDAISMGAAYIESLSLSDVEGETA